LGLAYTTSSVPSTAEELKYAADFASKTRGDGLALPSTTWHGFFSWACHNHAVAMSEDGFNVLTSNGTTMNDALVQVLGFKGDTQAQPMSQTSGEPLAWVDDCAGWECGAGCRD